MPNYSNQGQYRPYSPKQAVKTFTDLDIYQRAEQSSVFVCAQLIPALKKKNPPKAKRGAKRKTPTNPNREAYQTAIEDSIVKSLANTSLEIPRLIAEAHSKRFGTGLECLAILDKVMLKCNLAVVYLEQARDILDLSLQAERLNEQIQTYFYIRRKTLNLQRVWRKYIQQNQQ